MNRRTRFHFIVALCLAALVGGCAVPGGVGYPTTGTYPPPTPGAPLGALVDIRGPNAFYQRASAGPVLRAVEGQPVYAGDRIFTGQATRMTMRFARGGQAELDEMTDPVPRFLSDLGCLVVDLLRTGRMFVNGNDICVGAVGTIARQDSQVVYDVRPGYAEITVAGGRAQLLRPQTVAVPPGWRVEANARQVLRGGAYQLTRAQVEEAVRWTRWYQQRRPALPGITESPATPQIPRVTRPESPRAPEPVTPPVQTPPPTATTPPVQTPPPAQPGTKPGYMIGPPVQSTTPATPSSPPTRVIPRLQRMPQSGPTDTLR